MRPTARRLTLCLCLLLLIPACFQQVADCIGTAFGSAFARSFALLGYESSQLIDRPDDVRPGSTWIGGAHEDGRLVAIFDGPPVSGVLPRTVSDGGCESTGDFAWLFRADAGPTENLSATLTVTQQARTDAGIPTLFRFTAVSAQLKDGGTRPVANRDISVVLP